jgi:CheY-like chemotaxis protein
MRRRRGRSPGTDSESERGACGIRRLEHLTGEYVPIIAMAAHALQRHRDDCISAGIDALLTKPVIVKQLPEVLKAVTATAVPRSF